MIQKNTTYRNSASLEPAGGGVCQQRGLLVRRLCQGLCCRRQSVSQSMHAYFQSMPRIQNLHLFISPTYVYFQSTFRPWHSLLTRPVASTATVVTGTARLYNMYVCSVCSTISRCLGCCQHAGRLSDPTANTMGACLAVGKRTSRR